MYVNCASHTGIACGYSCASAAISRKRKQENKSRSILPSTHRRRFVRTYDSSYVFQFYLDLRDDDSRTRGKKRECLSVDEINKRVHKWKSTDKCVVGYCETSALTMQGLAKCFTTGVRLNNVSISKLNFKNITIMGYFFEAIFQNRWCI